MLFVSCFLFFSSSVKYENQPYTSIWVLRFVICMINVNFFKKEEILNYHHFRLTHWQNSCYVQTFLCSVLKKKNHQCLIGIEKLTKSTSPNKELLAQLCCRSSACDKIPGNWSIIMYQALIKIHIAFWWNAKRSNLMATLRWLNVGHLGAIHGRPVRHNIHISRAID